MAVPTTRETFIQTCLRKLGAPVIQINVSASQIDDAVDYSLQRAKDYHFDFSFEKYYTYQITQTDVTNKWIPVPADTNGAVEIFDLSSELMGGGIFNAQYQFVLQNVWSWQNISVQPYFIGFQYLQFLEQILVGRQPLRYNRYQTTVIDDITYGQVWLDMDWSRITVGNYVVVKIYQTMDPNNNPIMWSDSWFQTYTTAQIKKYWGNNLKKYSGMPIPGGLTFNGQQIYDEAVAEIADLEEKVITDYSLPVPFFMGSLAFLLINAPIISKLLSVVGLA